MFSRIFCFFLFSSLCFSQIQLTNYTYNTHGEDWNISVCLKGFKQSPINISDHNITAYSNIHYFFAKYSSAASTANYLNVSLEISANDQNLGYGTLLTVVPDSRGSKKAFLAQSILFRSPAEHIVNNYRYPLEVQIYHKLEKASFTQYAVVSIFFNNSDNGNDFLNNIIVNNQSNKNTYNVDLTSLIDFGSSDDLEYWAYQGSLTMPTCDETVNWYLMKNVYNATNQQIGFFTELYHNNPNFQGDGNFREIQTGNRSLNINLMDFKRT